MQITQRMFYSFFLILLLMMMFNLLLKLYLSKITVLIKLQQCLIKETIRWVYTKLHLMAEGSDPIICTEQKLI
jgi:hypothetical protein